jgi:hypothetical protein
MWARTYGLLDSSQRLVSKTGPGGEEAMAWVVVQRREAMGGAEGGALVIGAWCLCLVAEWRI